MMITVKPIRGPYINERLAAAGYKLAADLSAVTLLNGSPLPAEDEAAVLVILRDSADVYAARIDALAAVKTASAEKRLRYVTQAAGKDAEYTFKAQEAEDRYQLGSYSGPVGTFMLARIDATGETANAITDEWRAKAAAWKSIGAQIAAVEDKTAQDLAAAADLAAIDSVAAAAIAAIEAI